ncbi:MAG: hypothetical protein IPG71_14410 [bacterium]|nr:hypothetical protein [bacterium]
MLSIWYIQWHVERCVEEADLADSTRRFIVDSTLFSATGAAVSARQLKSFYYLGHADRDTMATGSAFACIGCGNGNHR